MIEVDSNCAIFNFQARSLIIPNSKFCFVFVGFFKSLFDFEWIIKMEVMTISPDDRSWNNWAIYISVLHRDTKPGVSDPSSIYNFTIWVFNFGMICVMNESMMTNLRLVSQEHSQLPPESFRLRQAWELMLLYPSLDVWDFSLFLSNWNIISSNMLFNFWGSGFNGC